MQFRLVAFAVALVSVTAQNGPGEAKTQLTWQGEVDGAAFLYVHAKRLIVETKDGGRVARQRYRIREPLPASRQDVRLHVSDGRGYVHILEQPRAENDYTLAVAIEDRQSGRSFYSIAVDWDAGGIFDRPGGRGRNRLKWSGRVERQAMVSCADSRCTSDTGAGAPVMHERFNFTRPLPRREVAVVLESSDGRGEVRIVEQPSEANGYTARVQIRDPQSGFSDYTFVLTWNRDTDGTALAPPRASFFWSGRVQGTVRVTVHGGASYSEVVSGAPIAGEQARFDRPLPARSDLKPIVRKRQGSGDVEVIEYPGSGNGYHLVFEIRNPVPSADMYDIEVEW